MVEIWFGIFSRKALRAGNFKSTTELREAIEAYLEAYKEIAKPFVWKKREVNETQLKNAIGNLATKH